jgi:hypothetical protein
MNVKGYLFIFLTVFLCPSLMAQDILLVNYASSILQKDLQRHVAVLASDSLQGREAGTPGGWMAGDYIADRFEEYGLKAPYGGSYFQEFDTLLQARNVIGVIEGTDKDAGAVVVGAHYDHHGMYYYSVYSGADDNASGVAALLGVAKALSALRVGGYAPRRTIIFIAYDAKERSMAGSAYYVRNPIVPLKQTIACFNMDMLGRTDMPPHEDTNYVLAVGLDKHVSDIRTITDYVNLDKGLNLDIDYTFYGSQAFSDLFYHISDQYNFGERGVPVAYFTSGMHDDLWKPGDDPEKISYPVLQKRAQLIFYTVWEKAK